MIIIIIIILLLLLLLLLFKNLIFRFLIWDKTFKNKTLHKYWQQIDEQVAFFERNILWAINPQMFHFESYFLLSNFAW
jgi:hypothetical protein